MPGRDARAGVGNPDLDHHPERRLVITDSRRFDAASASNALHTSLMMTWCNWIRTA